MVIMGMTEVADMKTGRFIKALEMLNYSLFLMSSPPSSSGDHSNGTTGLGIDVRDM